MDLSNHILINRYITFLLEENLKIFHSRSNEAEFFKNISLELQKSSSCQLRLQENQKLWESSQFQPAKLWQILDPRKCEALLKSFRRLYRAYS